MIDQIHRIAQTRRGRLWAGALVSVSPSPFGALISCTQAMFSALNIAYGEPERRSVLHFYVSAIGYTFIGIIGGVAMLFAIVYVPVLFYDAWVIRKIYQSSLLTYLRWPVSSSSDHAVPVGAGSIVSVQAVKTRRWKWITPGVRLRHARCGCWLRWASPTTSPTSPITTVCTDRSACSNHPAVLALFLLLHRLAGRGDQCAGRAPAPRGRGPLNAPSRLCAKRTQQGAP